MWEKWHHLAHLLQYKIIFISACPLFCGKYKNEHICSTPACSNRSRRTKKRKKKSVTNVGWKAVKCSRLLKRVIMSYRSFLNSRLSRQSLSEFWVWKRLNAAISFAMVTWASNLSTQNFIKLTYRDNYILYIKTCFDIFKP